MTPEWLHIVAIISLLLAGVCALVIAADEVAGHREHMWIMNVVWARHGARARARPQASERYFGASMISARFR